MSDSVYCIDTSSLVQSAEILYPFRNFSGVWCRLSDLVSCDRLVVFSHVEEEIEKLFKGGSKVDDEVLRDVQKWVENHRSMLKGIDEDVNTRHFAVMAKYKKLVVPTKRGLSADPFLIAYAEVGEKKADGKKYVVMTQESIRGKKKRKKMGPSIADVCRIKKIDCTNILGLIQREGWKFGK